MSSFASTDAFAAGLLQRQQCVTENGAPSLRTSQVPGAEEKCGGRVDLFVKLERAVKEQPAYLYKLIDAAWKESPRDTMVLLYNARDRDGGKGERDVARMSLKYLSDSGRADAVQKNLPLLPTFGRWDDVLLLPGGIDHMARQLLEDLLASTQRRKRKLTKRKAKRQLVKDKDEDEDLVVVEEDGMEMVNVVETSVPTDDIIKADEKVVTVQTPITLAAKWAPTIKHKLDKKHNLCKPLIAALQRVYEAEVKANPTKWQPIRELLLRFSNKAGVGASGKLMFNERLYRRLLAHLREHLVVLERLMCQKRWNEINLNAVPSCAMKRMKKVLREKLGDKYTEWASSLKTGINERTGEVAKVNAGQLYCHDVVHDAKNYFYSPNPVQEALVNQQWVEQLKKMADLPAMRDVLAVVDVSGSMMSKIGTDTTVTAMDVAIALGLLTSSCVQGPFKDTFMTFTSEPQLFRPKGDDLMSKLRHMYSEESQQMIVGYDTNFQKVFDTILDTAEANDLPAAEMPKTVLVLSDMQFNAPSCGTSSYCTNFEVLKQKYADAGYPMPGIVFWCLRTSIANEFPVTTNEFNTAMVSGFSTNILKQVMEGDMTPWKVVSRVINDPRYKDIQV